MLRRNPRIEPQKLVFIIYLFILLGSFLGVSQASAYNRDKAVDYIRQFGEHADDNEYNPNYGYYNYDNEDNPYGRPVGNCANAVSQALIAGGMDLSYGDYDGREPNPNGHYTFVGASEDTIGSYLEGELHAQKTVMTQGSSTFPNLGKGDVVIFEYTSGTPPPGINILRHVVMVDSVVAGIPIVSGDNPARLGDAFYGEFFGESSEYKFDRAAFYHFPTAEEIGQPVQVWGTGEFYGTGALGMTIYEAGHNYLGWILNNTDSSGQDMVVGDDTSNLTGCTYHIRGWCTDAHKGIPDAGVLFTQPWTTDSPDHWAYWVRKAVIYGTQNAYYDGEILDAVWYITSRAGDYNDILASIAYPVDGPQKPIDIEPPGEVSSLSATPGDGEIVLCWTNPAEADFIGTIIRYRTDGIYPTDATDGEFATSKTAYAGSASSFTHKGLINGIEYKYTIFSYDEVSNYSPGVSISAIANATSVSPPAGTVGTVLTIASPSLGSKKGRVLIGNIRLKVVEWTNDSIRAVLTKVLSPGVYDVVIQPKEPKGTGSITMEKAFEVMAPQIREVTPTEGSVGQGITIIADFLGNKKGKVYLDSGSLVKACKVIGWTMMEGKFVVPVGLPPGVYRLIVQNKIGRGEGSFTVR